MTRTNEKTAKETTVEDTRPQWQIDREERDTLRNTASDYLMPDQEEALSIAIKALRNADFMLHEAYELDVDAMKAIDISDWKLRLAFPGLYESAIDNEDY